MAIEAMAALSTHGNIIRELRNIANIIESKPDSCIITVIDGPTTIFRIQTGFEPTEDGIRSKSLTELTFSYALRILPGE